MTTIPTLTNQKSLKVDYTSDGIAKSKTFTLSEGVNKGLSIVENDASGNQTTKTFSDITLDTIAPALSILTTIPTLTNQKSLKVDYTSDGIAKSKTFTLTEGVNKGLSVVETDASGNQTTKTFSDITLDTIAPSLSILTTIPSLTNQKSLKVDYTSDGIAKSKTFTLTEGDNKTLSISETDLAGNMINVILPNVIYSLTVYEYPEGSSASPIRKINPDSSYVEYFYDASGALTSYYECKANGDITVFDKDGATKLYTYNHAAVNASTQIKADMSVTTATGDVIEYAGGKIISVIRKDDGSRITNIELDDSGSLKNAIIVYTGGSQGVIYNGSLIQIINNVGVYTRFRDGKKATEYSSNTGIASYFYPSTGSALGYTTRVWTRDAVCLYDAKGAPISFIKSDGERVDYDSGRIKRITSSDGSIYNYYTSTTDATKVVLSGSTSDDNIPTQITYKADGSISETLNGKNNKITFTNNPQSLLINDQNTKYTYNFSDNSSQNTVEVNRDGISRIYDASGNLKSLCIDSKSTMIYDNGNISEIHNSDGSIIKNIVFGSDNSIISATVFKPDGIKVNYVGGIVHEIDQPDGAKLFYDANGNITRSLSNAGIAYSYGTVIENGISYLIATADNIDAIKDLNAIVYQKFDSSNILLRARKRGGTTIDYTYTKDSSGKILSTYANDGKSITTYDANNNITQVEVLPTTDDPVPTISKYEYNQIRHVYKGDKLVYNYTYESDNGGKETVVIQDVTTGDVKRYKDGILISVTDTNNVITSYGYNSDGKISKSIVASLGHVINTYTYSYSGDNTVIQDIDRIIRTYDKSNKLIQLEQNGQTYQYTYRDQADGTEATIQDLVSVKNDAGVVTNYLHGDIQSIIDDGTIITDVVTTNGNVSSYTVKKDGITYYIVNGKLSKEIKGDKTIIEYNAGGLVISVTDPTGKITKYSYVYSSSDQLEYIIATKDGLQYKYDNNGVFLEIIDTSNNAYYYNDSNELVRVITADMHEIDLSYANNIVSVYSSGQIKQNINSDIANFSMANLRMDTSNNNPKIQLASTNDLDYGDGSNGAFNPTSDGVLSGVKNYSSINIPAGVTITFDNATIKCNGPVLIAGTVSGNGTGYAGGIADGNEQGGGNDGSGSGKGGGGYGCRIDHFEAASGGGGGYGSAGTAGIGIHGNPGPGIAGPAYGDAQLTTLCMGSGGGAGGTQARPTRVGGSGGAGGGAIKIIAPNITVSGSLSACGANGGASAWAGGGGGSGGSIYLIGNSVSISGSLSVSGGTGGSGSMPGGAGGVGRIRIDYGSLTGNMPTPTPYMYQIPYQPQGQLVSQPMAVVATQFGHISANTDIPTGTNVVFMTRTGTSANLNDGTWSSWLAATSDSSGYKINSPVNSYIQYEAIFTTTDDSKTPSIYSNGDYAVKIDYSYNKSFNATAPPQDMPFKDFLTLALNLPVTPNIPSLTTTFTQADQITSVVQNSILSNSSVIETQSSQVTVLSQITMTDGTVIKYFNGKPISVTRSDGTDVSNFDVSAYSPDQVSGTKSDRQAQITLDISKSSKITTIIDDKPVSVYQRYDDGHMVLLTEYGYDRNGDLVSINLPYVRDSLESQVAQTRNQIAQERNAYLVNLAQQQGLVTTQIQAQFAAAFSQIASERAQLQPMLYQVVTKQKWDGWWIFGHWKTYTEQIEVPQVRDALNQLNEQERQINIQEADVYAQLNNQIKSAEDKLNADEGTALTAILNQQKTMQAQIINEETSPIIINYYRKILGRDPSDDELSQWVASVNYNSSLDVATLKATLLNSDERNQSAEFVASLKSSISDKLYSYINADTAGRQSILSSLGLTLSDAIALNKKSDIDAILSLLDKQNIHFGRSAFVSLQTLLSANNIKSDLRDLALKTILIDIFTGSFNPLTEGSLLELSMYSLTKTVSLCGLDVYNAKLNYDDLINAFASGGTLIAHFKNNHYVDVTNISPDGMITYVEHNKGQNGSSYTISRKDFENSWTGYTITKAKPTSTKVISDAQAQRIKGSCLEILIAAWVCYLGFLSAATAAAVAAISVVISSISAILAPIISAIGAIFTSIGALMADIGTAVFSTISFVGNSLLPTIGAFFTNIGSFVMSGLSAFGSAVGNAIGFSNLSTLGITLGKTIVTTALSIGVSNGLDAIGVNPIVSNLISSFVTGGVSGLFSNVSMMGFIGGGLRGLAIQSVNVIGQKLGIAPSICSVIGIAAGSIINAGLNGVWEPVFDKNGIQIRSDFVTGLEAISYTMETAVLPNVASELVYSGVTELGNVLGVDPRISQLAGIGIRSTINPGVDQFGNVRSVWDSVTTGLLQGVTSIVLQWSAEKLNLSPFAGALAFNILGATFEAMLNHKNIFLNISQYAGEGIMNLFTLGGVGNDPWQQAAYTSQVLDFSRLVREQGILYALETYATGIFHQQTINMILKDGGIFDMATGRAEVYTDIEGVSRKRFYVNYEKKYYLEVNAVTGELLEKFEKINGRDVLIKQQYELDASGKSILTGRVETEIFDNGIRKVSTFASDGKQIKIEVYGQNGSLAFEAIPLTGDAYIKYDANGNMSDFIFKNLQSDINYYYKDGDILITSVDNFGDAAPEPTYQRDVNKNNFDNAVDYLESKFSDMDYRLSGSDIFGSSAYDVYLKSIILSDMKFQMKYGSELDYLTMSMTDIEKSNLYTYATLKFDSMLNPWDYGDIPTLDELAQYQALVDEIHAPKFVLVGVHGATKHPDGWASYVEKIQIKGENFKLIANSYNKPGPDSPIKGSGIEEYIFDPAKRRIIIEQVKNDIKAGWEESQRSGIPIDLAAHSLGTVVTYEALKELAAERPEIKVRNLYMMGSPLKYFIDKGIVNPNNYAFANVTNIVNIYNPVDALNLARGAAIASSVTIGSSQVFGGTLISGVLNDLAGPRPVTGELKSIFPKIKDVVTLVPHGAMWKDPRMLKIVEENGIFN